MRHTNSLCNNATLQQVLDDGHALVLTVRNDGVMVLSVARKETN